jgi:hypothetical protein
MMAIHPRGPAARPATYVNSVTPAASTNVAAHNPSVFSQTRRRPLLRVTARRGLPCHVGCPVHPFKEECDMLKKLTLFSLTTGAAVLAIAAPALARASWS